MAYQGRSPIKDVVRSVVMGAAMLSPAALEACSGSQVPQPPKPPDPSADGGVAAPDNTVVRPRTDPTNGPSMPTRGFAGAVRRG